MRMRMRMRLGVVVGCLVGLAVGGVLFVVFPQGPVSVEQTVMKMPSGSVGGDGGWAGDPIESVSVVERLGWEDVGLQEVDLSLVGSNDSRSSSMGVVEELEVLGGMEEVSTVEDMSVSMADPEPLLGALPEQVPVAESDVVDVSVQDQEVGVSPVQLRGSFESPVSELLTALKGVPAGDPMVVAFARVTLITFDLADAYGPVIEAAKASGTDAEMRAELARETRTAIEEEFPWGFDAYVTFAQEVRRNPALEADVARVMAALRP